MKKLSVRFKMFVTHYPQAWLALLDSLIRILTFAQFCPNLERKYMCWFIRKEKEKRTIDFRY